MKNGQVIDYVLVINAGGHPKYKNGDIVEADELVGVDGRAKKKGVEFEPFCFYLSAWEEDKYIIAQANVELDENGRIIAELVNARQAGNFVLAPRDADRSTSTSRRSSWCRWPPRWFRSSRTTTPTAR